MQFIRNAAGSNHNAAHIYSIFSAPSRDEKFDVCVTSAVSTAVGAKIVLAKLTNEGDANFVADVVAERLSCGHNLVDVRSILTEFGIRTPTTSADEKESAPQIKEAS